MENRRHSGQTLRQVFRYLLLASAIVSIEVSSFMVMNSLLHLNYLLSTILSMIVGIVLNWLGSKIFVFNKSRFHPVHEFLLVLMVSLVGIGIQLAVVWFVVNKVKVLPVAGKVLAIMITFIWNFFIRKTYIFKEPNIASSDIDPYLP